MKRIALIITITLTAFLANYSQTVDEQKTRAFFDKNDLVTELVVNSDIDQSAAIKLELIDQFERGISTEAKAILKKGETKVPVKMTFGYQRNVKDLVWKRLRYTVKSNQGESKGIVSISSIMPDLFGMEANSLPFTRADSNMVVRIETRHPVTNIPVPNVELTASLKLAVLDSEGDEDTLVLKTEGITDAAGFATIFFQIPTEIRFDDEDYDDSEIEIIGSRNGVHVSVSEDVSLLTGRSSVLINTDKPLYQPGQTLFVRGLALQDEDSKGIRAPLRENELEFRVKDEDDTTLYRETVTTSRFGIASIRWQIPDNAKLGRYEVTVEIKGTNTTHHSSFRVSRYELPNFVVTTRPDKPYYLPKDKKATVKIDALYLFGKPVVKGKIRVVRETEREWDFAKQEWDISEEESYEGELDDKSVWEAKINLREAHKELKEDDDEKFRDLHFTAYLTDSTTNLTEERRFDIRISKQDIHVYFVGLRDQDHNDKLPLRFFVTTSLADGNPVSADIELKGRYRDRKGKRQPAGTLKTNRFGAARAEVRLPLCGESCSDYFELEAVAKDAQKREGSHIEERISIEDDEIDLQIRTSNTILKKGETIELEVFSNAKDRRVFINAIKAPASVLSAHDIKLVDGYSRLSIPYQEAFEGRLELYAYFENDGDYESASASIVYPAPKSLSVSAGTDKEIYRPASDVSLKYDVTSPAGSSGETALGVYVLDRAVEERALTDSNFGGAFDPFDAFRGELGGYPGFGGVSIKDVEGIDMDNPIDPDIELAAEIMLYGSSVYATFYDANISKPGNAFKLSIERQMGLVSIPLNLRYSVNFEHPTDFASFDRILKENEIDFSSLRDPWGQPYDVAFSVSGENNIVTVTSRGPNKTQDDDEDDIQDDDFTAIELSFKYFTETGQKFDKAVDAYTERTGKFVRDKKTLALALEESGINILALKDRWDAPYEFVFDTEGRSFEIDIKSAGPYKGLSIGGFRVWTNKTDYFSKHEDRIQSILDAFTGKTKSYPADEKEFKKVLKEGGLDIDKLRDGWGNRYYIETRQSERFADRVQIETEAKPGDTIEQRFRITAVTQLSVVFEIRSNGENGKKETRDWRKPRIARFSGIISERLKDDNQTDFVVPKTMVRNGKGAIYGTVTDQNGAAIPGAAVTVVHVTTGSEISIITDEDGGFLVGSIPAGSYILNVSATGFKRHVVSGIVVGSEKIVNIDSTLEAGDISATVDVTADVSMVIDTASTKIDTNISRQLIETLPKGTAFGSLLKIAPGVVSQPLSGGFQIEGASGAENTFIVDGQQVTDFRTGQFNLVNVLPKKETPRVRNYFPETLLWAPEVVTDKDGKTTIKFTLADNITTWKIYAIASNLEGRIGVSEKSIKTFQPFFVDLLPPRILTNGDEISLPVQVRNYTDSKQDVEVTLRGENWFETITSSAPQTRSARGTAITPLSSPDDAMLNVATNVVGRIAARSGSGELQTREIEGESRVRNLAVDSNATANAVFDFKAVRTVSDGVMNVTAKAAGESDAIEKPVTVKPDGKEIVDTELQVFSGSAEFKHAFPENALAGTPAAELRIYPNIFAHVSESVSGLLQRPYGCGEQTVSSTYPNLMILKFTKEDSKLRKTAAAYLQKGYERLLGYQVTGGGFSYWGGNDDPDIALTAYALRFLNDANEFIDVDETSMRRAKEWLAEHQRTNGSWSKVYSFETGEDTRRTWQISTYVVRALAETVSEEDSGNLKTTLELGLLYLDRENKKLDEPYSLANLGLAYTANGQSGKALAIASRLRSMAKQENGGFYWNLETNTPFFGWGTAGRLETTAVVLQLLRKVENSQTNDPMISGAIAFLLRNKDRFGVWHSTQATINVLEALLISIDSNLEFDGAGHSASVFVNGQKLKDIELPPAGEHGFPISLDISKGLVGTLNKVEIRSDAGQTLQAQIVWRHYITWDDFRPDSPETSSSKQLALVYDCDKYQAKPTEEISCAVKAERVGFKGYGMLLAEIGIPPGADVDRASLDRAMKEDWSFSRYDVLPDRIVIYMWSKAGGTEFGFKFKPRYGINAQTPASTVYDYYNEEARATVVPKRFLVK